MRRTWYILIAALLFLFSCSHPKQVTLTFLETTDLHGSIFPYDFVRGDTVHHSLAQISTYIKEQRKNKAQNVILIDNGDILQGSPVVYYYNYIDTSDTHIMAQVFNFLNYDVAVVGNHDIEAGHKVYDKLRKEFNFPWLSANTVDVKTGKPYFKPYVILKRGGLKIAILGLTTPGIPHWLPPNLYSGMRFEDMIKTARKWVKIIKQKEHPDILIGSFHSGHDYTYENQDSTTCCNDNASVLVAEEVPGFDFIFIGHDHDLWMDTVVNVAGDTVYIIDPASHAKYIGQMKVTLTWNKKLGKYVKHFEPAVIKVDTIPVDEEFMNKFRPVFEKVKKYVSDTVGYLAEPLDGKQAFFGDSKFVDFIHKVQLNVTGAQISFAAPLSFRAYLDSGAVTVGKLFGLYRFTNMLYEMRMRGSEIHKYLEYSVSHWFNTMHSPDDHLLKFKPGTNRLMYKFYNFDDAEGINYTVDLTKPDGHKVTITGLSNGQPFDSTAWYTVAVNSYRGNGGGGLMTAGAGIPHDSLRARIIKSTDKDVRYYIMQTFEKSKVIVPSVDNNWTLQPKDWVEKAKKRDWDILFGKKN